MDKKYCVFDMDGTLVDSMGYWQGMEREYLARRGAQPGPALEELIERLKPMTLGDAAKAFIAELGFSGTPEQIVSEMNAIMEDNYRTRVPLKPGVKEYLTALKERGATLCTASATVAWPSLRVRLTRQSDPASSRASTFSVPLAKSSARGVVTRRSSTWIAGLA